MKHVIFAMGLLSILVGIPQAQVADTTVSDSVAMEHLPERSIGEGFPTTEEVGSEIKFFGDYYVGLDEISRDNIRIVGGDLHVAGTVEGQIAVLGGDVNLESTAVVNGRIIAIGGSVFKKEGAVVNGKIIEANIKEGITYSEKRDEDIVPDSHEFRSEEEIYSLRKGWIHPETRWFIYNRNEGFLLTPFNWHWNRHGQSSFRVNLSLGWRFGQQELAGKLTLEKAFFPRHNFILFASAFKESRTDDYYRLPELENSIASVVARQDFYDRWDEEGYEAGVGFQLQWLKAKLSYRSVQQDSMAVINLWSVFHKDRYLRPNLNVLPGDIATYNAAVTIRTRGFNKLHSGVAATVTAEQVVKADTSEDYTRILASATINWQIAEGVVLRSRMIGGTSRGTLPQFRYFFVGGLGSVAAYRYKQQPEQDQPGSQMLQANLELVLQPEFLDDDCIVALFTDAGHAWDKREYTFSDIDSIVENSISSVGIGVGDEDMDWRVNIARPLDGRDFWETTLRLNFNF